MSLGLVLLTVLKYIGFVLLGILALALVIILLALFIPITYSIRVSKADEFQYKIKVFLFTVAASDKPKKPKKPKKKKDESEEVKKTFFEQIKELYNVIKTVYEELTRPANSYTLGQLSRMLVKIVKSYGPRRLESDIDFGLDDPMLTGLIVGAVSIFPLSYAKHVDIRPDFEAEANYFRGYAMLSGRVQLCVAVGCIFRLLGDSTVRKNLFRILKKINK